MNPHGTARPRPRTAAAGWYRDWADGWRGALRCPAVARRLPAEAIRVLAPDGTESIWRGGSRVDLRTGDAEFEALLLPPEMVLQHALLAPTGSGKPLQALVARELAAVNPFGAEAIAWGWGDPLPNGGESYRLILALAARNHIDRYIDSQRHRLRTTAPEIWAGTAPPVILHGYGEGARRQREAAARRTCGTLLAAAVALAAILVAMPVYLKQQRAAQAEAALAALGAEIETLTATREALTSANRQAEALAAHFASRTEMLGLLTRLSEAVPEDAHLDLVEIHGDRVLITGRAANASALMDTLGAQPGFREMRAPVAIARDPTAGNELFSLEFKLASSARQP